MLMARPAVDLAVVPLPSADPVVIPGADPNGLDPRRTRR